MTFDVIHVRKLNDRPYHVRVIEDAAVRGERKVTLTFENKAVANFTQITLREGGFGVGPIKRDERFSFEVSW